MLDGKKCNNDQCNNIIVDRNKKTKEYKKFCSNSCRYSVHSTNMKTPVIIDEAPICKYHLCNEAVTRTTTGRWRIFCNSNCQNKSTAFEKSDFSKGPAPACANTACINIVLPARYGHWHTYCSRRCAGKFNSSKSREKSADTCLKRYGVSNPSLSADFISKSKITKIDRYGIGWSPHIGKIGEEAFEKLTDATWLSEQNKTRPLNSIAEELGLSPSSLGVRFRAAGLTPNNIWTGVSKFEKEVSDFIRSLGILPETSVRNIIAPKELDIYVVDYSLAIECNGTYWHSESNGKDRNYHLDKTIACNELGLSLIHVTNTEWKYKRSIIESLIKNRLGKSNKIYARLCECKIVDKQDEKQFLIDNHIQGYVPSDICYGLYYGDKLIQILSFGKSRFATADAELLRSCTQSGISVVGGMSKIFKKYIDSHITVKTIVSYSHKDKFNGQSYIKLGFQYSHSSSPAYYYTLDYDTFKSRFSFQKHKLHKLLKIFDPGMTEWENMQANGYDRIWDCGNDVWMWNRPGD
jgi:hypothetical protein